jgi:hypothetical protein
VLSGSSQPGPTSGCAYSPTSGLFAEACFSVVERADAIHQHVGEDTTKDGAYTYDRNEVEYACADFEERTWGRRDENA